MRAADVLQRHVDLTEYIKDSTLRTLMVSLAQYSNGYTEEEGYDVTNVIARSLTMAKTYVIEPTMIPQIMECAEHEIDDTVSFGKQVSPPSPYGFMYFPEPLRHRDRRGRCQYIHAVVWSATRDRFDDHGFSIAMFNDMDREPDEIMMNYFDDQDVQRLARLSGGWSPVGVTVVGNRAKIGPYYLFCTPAELKMIRDDGDTPEAYTINVARVVLATWKLMSETIDYGETHIETPERAVARRAKRSGVSPEVMVVNLRRLRHRTKNPGTGKPLEWRQEIPGHWRMQAYGPGRRLRRKIWIDDFWQGPENAPVRPAKPKVIRLTR
jgi:hypothetical protein